MIGILTSQKTEQHTNHAADDGDDVVRRRDVGAIKHRVALVDETLESRQHRRLHVHCVIHPSLSYILKLKESPTSQKFQIQSIMWNTSFSSSASSISEHEKNILS